MIAFLLFHFYLLFFVLIWKAPLIWVLYVLADSGMLSQFV